MSRAVAKNASFGMLYGKTKGPVLPGAPEPSAVDRLAALADPDGPAADRVPRHDDPQAYSRKLMERWKNMTAGIEDDHRRVVSLMLEQQNERWKEVS